MGLSYFRKSSRCSQSISRAVSETLECRRLLSAQLIKDIDTMKPGADLVPAYITSAGNVAFLTDDDGTTGEEIWKTDGTTANTTLVKDLYPGPAGSFPGGYTTLGAITYFSANEPTDGTELWRTDGTSAGTYLLKDINPGSASSTPFDFTAYNGLLYFAANDGVHGRELWKSDGTAAGTVMVADTYVGASGQPAAQLGFHRITVSGSNVLFYTAYDGTNNNLYTITGSGPLTLVKQQAYTMTAPGLLAGSGSLVFYTDILGYIYQSDGTSAGSVTDDATNSSASNLTIGGNYLYYVRNNAIKCVGGGTIQTVTSAPLTSPTILGALGSQIFFSVTQSGTPQVWYSYGGGNFSGLVVNNVIGTTGVAVGNLFYFVTGSSTAGYSLYKVAAAPSAATLIGTINAGGALSAPTGLAAQGSKLLFINTDAVNGTQPWVSDGTAAGTTLLKAIYPGTAGSSPQLFAAANGRAFFSANDGVTGTEPYITDGTTAGTFELKDINPGSNFSSPSNVMVVGTRFYFSAFDATNGDALWVTDGTVAGTSLLIATGSTSTRPAPMAYVNGFLLFSANDATHGTELWRTDGTTANTQLVADIYSGTSSSSPSRAVVLNGYAYFTATDAAHGTELWRSDGTTAGTTLVSDVYPGSTSSSISSLFVDNQVLLFAAQSSSTGSELWKSDGTAAGTVLVKDINPGSTSSTPSGFVLYNGQAYFAAKGGTNSGLWVTDGTAAGTQLIAEDAPSSIVAANGKLYFLGSVPGQSTDNLYVSQGTPNTTQVVSSTPSAILNYMTVVGGRLFFFADDGSGASYELWTSDGTASGTAMVQDLFPGSFQGASSPIVDLNSAVVLRGDNSVTGSEPYEFPDIYPPELDAASANVAAATYTINFSFSENVAAHLSATSLQLQNLTTSQSVAVASTGYSYNSSTNTATFTLPAAALSDGRYRATIAASLLIDPQGNAATSAATTEFLAVAGTGGDDAIRIQLTTDNTGLQVYKAGGLSFTTPVASLGSVIVTGGSGNDSLSINLGASMPAGGFSFDGGSGSNSLSVTGTSGTHWVAASSGVFTYDSLPINSINAASIAFDAAGGTDAVADASQLAFASGQSVGRTISALNLTGILDVNNNALDLPGASLSTISAMVQSAFHNGAWSGSGLTSSAAAGDSSHLTTVGTIQNNQGGSPLFSSTRLFDGTSPGASDILLKYTYFGDANLDGKVDGSDYTRIDSSYATHTGTGWYNGDFNYDGVINGSDYTLIDNAFNTQGASLAAQVVPTFRASKLVSSVVPEASIFSAFGSDSLDGQDYKANSVAAQIFSQGGDEWIKRSKFSRRQLV